MKSNEQYEIVISSGNLDDDNLVAEIYTNLGAHISSVSYNGTEVVLDFTCLADNHICRSEKMMPIESFISAVNDCLNRLEIQMLLNIEKRNGMIRE